MLYRLFDILISRRFLYKRIKQVKKYLVKGVFTIESSGKIVYKNDHQDSIKFINSFFDISLKEPKLKGFKKFISYYLLNKRIKIKETINKFSFQGTIILFSNKLKTDVQYGDLKIFDTCKKEILTSYYTERSYHKKLYDTGYFNKYFNIPNIKENCDSEWVTIEELIEFIPEKKFDSNNYLETSKYLLQSHVEYFRHCFESKKYSSVKIIHYFDYAKLHEGNKANLDIIKSLLGNVFLGMYIPIVYQHGDLSFSNILLAENRTCYIIDWEHASEFTLLYDIMWPWQNIALHNHNFFIVENYLNGVFDRQMHDVFFAFNIEYDPKSRIKYFLTMIAELIYHRVLKKEPENYNNFLNDSIMPMIKKTIYLNEKLQKEEISF